MCRKRNGTRKEKLKVRVRMRIECAFVLLQETRNTQRKGLDYGAGFGGIMQETSKKQKKIGRQGRTRQRTSL